MIKIKLEVAIAHLKERYQYQSSVDAFLIMMLIDHIEANSGNTVLCGEGVKENQTIPHVELKKEPNIFEDIILPPNGLLATEARDTVAEALDCHDNICVWSSTVGQKLAACEKKCARKSSEVQQ